MRTCEAIRAILLEEASEHTGPSLPVALREHVASCPACARRRAELQRTVSLLRELAVPEPASDSQQRLLCALRQRHVPPAPAMRRTVRLPLPHLRVPPRHIAVAVATYALFSIHPAFWKRAETEISQVSRQIVVCMRPASPEPGACDEFIRRVHLHRKTVREWIILNG